MLKLKKLFIIAVLFIIIFINISSVSYATSVSVTEENLNTALQNFVSSSSNEENYKISMSNGIITVTTDDGTYNINYDLTNTQTFYVTIPITQGMTYEKFKTETENLSLPMIGYIAVANVQGVSFEDASSYFTMCLLIRAFSNMSSSSSSKYIIASDDNTVESDDSIVIYESEFGEHVMEYVNEMYGDKQTFSDSADIDGLNTFTWTTEQTEVTSTSCNLVSTITIDLTADFSKLNGYTEQLSDSFLNSDITPSNADYNITLKVGQKCRIETTETITGHELSGTGYEYNKVSETCAEITGESVGKANGYLYIGETKKSVYITVEENSGNSSLETITLKIETTSNTSNENNNNSEDSETDTSNNLTNTNTDNTITTTILPKTGSNTIMFIIVIVAICILSIIFKIKLKNYRDVE